MTAEDAKLAVQHGVDGIIVSGHGGRQLDGIPAPVSMVHNVTLILLGYIYGKFSLVSHQV